MDALSGLTIFASLATTNRGIRAITTRKIIPGPANINPFTHDYDTNFPMACAFLKFEHTIGGTDYAKYDWIFITPGLNEMKMYWTGTTNSNDFYLSMTSNRVRIRLASLWSHVSEDFIIAVSGIACIES